MDFSSIALQALNMADVQLEKAATEIATAGATSADGNSQDMVDLSAEMVALMSAQNLFEANLATLKAADQMQRNAFDLKA